MNEMGNRRMKDKRLPLLSPAALLEVRTGQEKVGIWKGPDTGLGDVVHTQFAWVREFD